MTDGGEAAFDRVAGADALPVLCRKVIKGQQFLAILLQTKRGFGEFSSWLSTNRSKAFSAHTLRSACQMSCRARLALGCDDFGRRFKNIHAFVHPATMDRQFLETPFYGVRQMTFHLRGKG